MIIRVIFQLIHKLNRLYINIKTNIWHRISSIAVLYAFVRMHLYNCLEIKARTLRLNYKVKKRIMYLSCSAWSSATAKRNRVWHFRVGFTLIGPRRSLVMRCSSLLSTVTGNFSRSERKFLPNYATRGRLSWSRMAR